MPVSDLVIFVAHRWEARPFIEHGSLRQLAESPFPRFRNEEGLELVLTGSGAFRAATAMGAHLANRPAGSQVVANFGTAGYDPGRFSSGQWIIVSKIRDFGGQQNFYPDLLVRHEQEEGTCLTVGRAMNRPPEKGVVCDMEAAGFFCAAEQYLPPSRIAIGKFCFDGLDGSPRDWRSLTRELEDDYQAACLDFLQHLVRLRHFLDYCPRRSQAREVDTWVESSLALLAAERYSVTQTRQLRSRLRGFALDTTDEATRQKKLEVLLELSSVRKGAGKNEYSRVHRQLLNRLSPTTLFASLPRE